MEGVGRAGPSPDMLPLQTWLRQSCLCTDAWIEGDTSRTAQQGGEASAQGWTLSRGARGDNGGRRAAPAARSPSVITASRRPAPIRLLLIKPDVEMEMKT